MTHHDKMLALVLIALSLMSVSFTVSLFDYVQASLHLQVTLPRPSRAPKTYLPQEDEGFYSYVGDDFPPNLPGVPLDDRVQMVVEESSHYSFLPEAREAWYTAFPDGFGAIRLGHHHRVFYVSMYHELHCLQQFRDTLVDVGPRVDWGHLHHCLNYIRQRALCQADLTLEPGDFTKRDFARDRWRRTGATGLQFGRNSIISRTKVPCWVVQIMRRL
uniref:Oxidase ustYa n=1 Tax=Mycena chlorophos TaxID=658473 RepID=A0ABQ0MC29_MYCCL|nr:predicted protein [Mycena chlorophos]